MQTDEIRIERAHGPVVVKRHDAVIAASHSALLVHGERETPIYYLPRDDVYFEQMTRLGTEGEGDRTWFTVTASGGGVDHAAWMLNHPDGALSMLAGHVGFDPDRLNILAG